MLLLGVSGGHDANWCVVRDGRLVAAFEKERFTRRRHDGGEVMSLVPETLRRLGLEPDDIDVVATTEPVHLGTDSGLRRIAGERYEAADQWVHQIVELCGLVRPAIAVPHHLCHAAYARYVSGIVDDLAVLTWDGGGDFYTVDAYATTTVSSWSGQRLAWLERVDNADIGSLWWTYAAAIFGDGNHAGKLMGLAALGSDDLVDAVAETFLRRARGILDPAMLVKSAWPDEFDPPFVDGPIGWEDGRAQDLARAIQVITTRAALSIATAVQRATGARHLAIGGGVALNGYVNDAIARSGLFERVFVPPAANDGGLSVGAALFASHHELDVPWLPTAPQEWAAVGSSYSPDECRAALRAAGLEFVPVDPVEAVEAAADVVVAGGVVAWFDGPAEHGPRALGNRSILASAADVATKDRINRDVKFREPFRPLAPVVPLEDAHHYFDLIGDGPWMTQIVPGTERCRAEAPGALHVDGTARVQTVTPVDHLHSLCRAVEARTGTPIILNTSLNVRAPIANSPDDAIEAFQQVPIDLLHLGGNLVWRS